VTDVSDAQFPKQFSQINSTELGRAIDLNPLEQNATLSSPVNFESTENVTDVK
jgi:hypothetical protein